jgi:hypothetical protein
MTAAEAVRIMGIPPDTDSYTLQQRQRAADHASDRTALARPSTAMTAQQVEETGADDVRGGNTLAAVENLDCHVDVIVGGPGIMDDATADSADSTQKRTILSASQQVLS